MSDKETRERREFLIAGGAALAGAAVPGGGQFSALGQPKRLKLALAGTGSRGSSTWGGELVKHYSDVVEFVGLYDINHRRAEAAKKLIGTSAPTFNDFDRMVKESRPEAVIVATVDSTHARFIKRALELGCDVITEKPLCTDEEQCQAILDAAREAESRGGKKVTVAFNARHSPEAKKVKALLMEKAIGEVISVDFHEYLDTSHGADYFRRWHRLRENSGTLLVHKASHHFDQANWWLDSRPVEVTAFGELRFYGRNNSFRSTHCRVCPFKEQCKFYWDVTRNERYVKLYVDCEAEDGYLRDGCVWSEKINIYDTMSVTVKYENRARLNYTANTYLPLEGQSISFNGTKGRLDYDEYRGGGHERNEIRLTRSFGQSEVITNLETQREGGHGGSDTSLQDLLFRRRPGSDPLNLGADVKAGAWSSLIGIAAYRSIERGGQAVRLAQLVKL
ncbi:MAG TPA: Gfo/Idh/MocA family oxidoreductase [Blastocatellia bacterium]|nr:Gfo/Idh/MocA family oxidoreductase [Blastocatellia bacterium]